MLLRSPSSGLLRRRGQRTVAPDGRNRRRTRLTPRVLLDVSIIALMLYVGTVPLVLQRWKGGGRSDDADAAETPLDLPSVRGGGESRRPIGRGPNALPMSETPALAGARRGRIKCDSNVDFLAYWNDPQGRRDAEFRSPFAPPPSNATDGRTTRYLTFEPDRGGWNNLRMSFETIVTFAAATGRTLVLPPDQPLYLLRNDPDRLERGFGDFFDLDAPGFASRVPVITAEQFVEREGGKGGRFEVPANMMPGVAAALSKCEHRNKSDRACMRVYEYYEHIGYVPKVHGEHNCFVFDEGYLNGEPLDRIAAERVSNFCKKRTPVHYDRAMMDAPVVHFRTSVKEYRLLVHFYALIFFTNAVIGNFFKRFIRDRIHYNDQIFCAAGKIVRALQKEGQSRGFAVDQEGGGGFSSIHIRRGDFQWKNTRIAAEEWYHNTKDKWLDKEILYVTTDEKNRTYFDPVAAHHDLRFLEDFTGVGGLNKIDPNFVGMIEAVVASRGRVFVGTYFSSFSAYIGRMRGYHGMSPKEMWYGQASYAEVTHSWVDPQPSLSAREFPVGWVHIDGDEEAKGFPP